MIYWQYVNVGLKPVETYDDYLKKAEACAAKVFALNPDSSKGYVLRGSILNNRADPPGAIRAFKRAVAIDPNNPEALLWLAYGYAVSGRPAIAKATIERLLQVDPLTGINLAVAGMVAFFDGRHAEALKWTQRSVEIEPDNPSHRQIHALMLAANQRVEEACAILDKVAEDAPKMAWARLARAMKHALRGEREEVTRLMTPELKKAAWWDDIFSWWMTDCFALAGDTDAALDFLERTVQLGFVNYPFFMEYDPFIAGIRGEPRFREIMQSVRRAWESFDL
jgi:tetratricopeptide (TPR) repeat protein